MALAASELPREALKAGDYVEYYSLQYVFGDWRGRRIARILLVGSAESDHPLRLDSGDLLALTGMLRRVYPVLDRVGPWRKLRTFTLDPSVVAGLTTASKLNENLRTIVTDVFQQDQSSTPPPLVTFSPKRWYNDFGWELVGESDEDDQLDDIQQPYEFESPAVTEFFLQQPNMYESDDDGPLTPSSAFGSPSAVNSFLQPQECAPVTNNATIAWPADVVETIENRNPHRLLFPDLDLGSHQWPILS